MSGEAALGEAKFQNMVAAASELVDAAAAAPAKGLQLGALVRTGSYGTSFANGAAASDEVITLAWMMPGMSQQSAGGNRLLSFVKPETPSAEDVEPVLETLQRRKDVAKLLYKACVRQQRAPTSVLPALRGGGTLGDLPFARHERLKGTTLRTMVAMDDGIWPQIAAALLKLHNEFGPHGDLKPETILLQCDQQVRFLDPICDAVWFGTSGYTLGTVVNRRLADLGALVALMAELYGADVRWRGIPMMLARQRQGGPPVDSNRLAIGLDQALHHLPPTLRAWAMEVGRAYIEHACKGTEPDSQFCRRQLLLLSAEGAPLPVSAIHNPAPMRERTARGVPLKRLAQAWLTTGHHTHAHAYAKALQSRGWLETRPEALLHHFTPSNTPGGIGIGPEGAPSIKILDVSGTILPGRMEAVTQQFWQYHSRSCILFLHEEVPYVFTRLAGNLTARLLISQEAPKEHVPERELTVELGGLVYDTIQGHFLKGKTLDHGLIERVMGLLELLDNFTGYQADELERAELFLGFRALPQPWKDKLQQARSGSLLPHEQGDQASPSFLAEVGGAFQLTAYAIRRTTQEDGTSALTLCRLGLVLGEINWRFTSVLLWRSESEAQEPG